MTLPMVTLEVLGLTSLKQIKTRSRLGLPKQTKLGNLGNDELTGGADSDAIVGGLGNDILTGIDPSAPGLREIDALTGGGSSDVFVLGSKTTAFYNDGQNATLGWTDFALITDFQRNTDVIRLHGKANDYLLRLAPP